MGDTLSTNLKRLRLQRHYSIRELSRQSGVAVGTIRRIEEGGTDPYDHTLSKLADFLGVEITELKTGVAS